MTEEFFAPLDRATREAIERAMKEISAANGTSRRAGRLSGKRCGPAEEARQMNEMDAQVKNVAREMSKASDEGREPRSPRW